MVFRQDHKMKYNRKKHMTQKQLSDLTGLSFDSLSVRAKTDPKYPETLFIGNGHDIIYCRKAALEWLSWFESEPAQKLQKAGPRETKPLHQHGEYKPSEQLMINFRRASELYPHKLYTPTGAGLTHDNPNYRTY